MSAKPLIRVCLRLYEEDYRMIQSMSTADLKTNEIIRDVVHVFLLSAKDKLRAKLDEISTENKPRGIMSKDLKLDLDLSDFDQESNV